MGEVWILIMFQDVRVFIVQVFFFSYWEVDYIIFIVEDFDGVVYNSNNEIYVVVKLFEGIMGDL